MSNILLLNSGGIDSLAVAKKVSRLSTATLHSVYIDVGQLSRVPAKEAALKIAAKYCISHEVMQVFPDDRYHIEYDVGRNIPFLGAAIFMFGAIYARSRDIDFIASGLKNDGVSVEFNEKFLSLLATSKKTKVVIPLRPLQNYSSYEEIIEDIRGDELLPETWSCNRPKKCGECPKCLKRKELSID